ncbi:LacI family DNA-binding transcriptional regulator [Hufsiella ginkgonis]|uniref:Substrate-binding domain-containing protein n=1 Tax=Hufsiella ginkgonis TaxID=2695274 RepID=A0A7K1Y2X7_9SPHI|nr:LacI family DNA-binding transcriptional regulator [Hufsiella ginkgonis]MXV17643.1 substrate-binding domain-containing protein [Hufsiella ginkgonis]
MKKKTTIHDIAKELKTNISTVSRALNDHPAISTITKEAVKEMAQKLNYRQNKIASSLRSGRTHTIGVIIPSAELHFFGSVVHAIEQAMNRNGYTVLLYQSNESFEQEVKGIETFLQLHVDGIIASIALGTKDFDHFKEIKKRNIPLILFDRTNDTLEVPSVFIDDYKGGYIATEHLIRQGYHRIAHINSRQQIKIFNDRLRGYRDALSDYGLPYEERLVEFGDVSIESGKICTEKLLSQSGRPDAIFAVEDFTAMGAIQQLKTRGIAVPAEFGVIGFANEGFSPYITPSLSTIDQQTRIMGKTAAGLFLDSIGKGEEPVGTSQIVLDPVLVVRESTGRQGV